MNTLNDFLQKNERIRGEEEAGRIRTVLLLIMTIWSIFEKASPACIILLVLIAVLNHLFIVIRQKAEFLNPYLIVSLELILISQYSFIISPGEIIPILPFMLIILYSSSLRLRVSLIFMTGVESIILMNSLYLFSLIPKLETNLMVILEWPGMGEQLLSTGLLIFFTSIVLSRPRIIRRLIDQQQIYFDSIRNENTIIRDSLDFISTRYKLSKREKEVIEILIQGKTYRMIAGELFISPDTVKSHIKSIYRKCEVGNKAELLQTLQETVLVRKKESE